MRRAKHSPVTNSELRFIFVLFTKRKFSKMKTTRNTQSTADTHFMRTNSILRRTKQISQSRSS